MMHIFPTEKWLEGVVKLINDRQLNPEDSKFMIAFFSSMDIEFVMYFLESKKQISSFSGQNFHIFTPLIYEDRVISDDDWRHFRSEFRDLGIPVDTEPTFVFFNIIEKDNGDYEPKFFAGFECTSFDGFPRKLRNAINKSIETNDPRTLAVSLSEIFLAKNIIPVDRVHPALKNTITNKLPKSTIFISHSSHDKSFARKLEAALSDDKLLNFWIDEREISVSDDIQKTISDNLKKSDYLLLLISSYSTKSNWVNFEVSQFMGFKNGDNIIPIIISKGQKFSEPIDNQIRRLKYLDFSDDSKWGSNIEELKKKLKKE